MKISLTTPAFVTLLLVILAVFLSLPIKTKTDTRQSSLDALRNIEKRAAERKAKYDADRQRDNLEFFQEARQNPFGGRS